MGNENYIVNVVIKVSVYLFNSNSDNNVCPTEYYVFMSQNDEWFYITFNVCELYAYLACGCDKNSKGNHERMFRMNEKEKLGST